MSVRITSTTVEAYAQFQQMMRRVKTELIGSDGLGGIYVRLQTLSVAWQEIWRLQDFLTDSIGLLDTVAAVPGIVAYVKTLLGDATYDVGAEYQSVRTALVTLRDAIFNGLPKVVSGGNSYLAVQILDQSGGLTDRTFTPVQTANFRTLIDSFRTTIA